MIDIKNIRLYMEDTINKKIEDINDPSLSYDKKRLKILSEMNTSLYFQDYIDFPRNTIEIIDIREIRQFEENRIQEKIKNIKDERLIEKQKRLLVLDEMNTSISYSSIEEENKGEDEYEKNKIHMDSISFHSISMNETNDVSKPEISNICEVSEDVMDCRKRPTAKNNVVKIDSITIENYNKSVKFYDVIQNIYLEHPSLHKADEDKFYYIYNNDLMTYYFIQSKQFGKDYSIKLDVLTDDKYDKSLGLFFCGKTIELDNEKDKKCSPNEMICKNCMKKNKKRYNLKDKYSININGRAAKKYNNSFHCFGHFLNGDKIENCGDNFQCEACKLLDKYEKYYFTNK